MEINPRYEGERQADQPVTPTGGEAAPAKEKVSVKEAALSEAEKKIPNKNGRVYPITNLITFGWQVWRPFDQYVKDKWMTHASRLSGVRDSGVPTPFGKKFPWSETRSEAIRMVKGLKNEYLKEWEFKEAEDMPSDFKRGTFYPLMYCARIILYDPRWYPTRKYAPRNKLDIPKFQALSSYADIEIRPDAKTANTGFPWLTSLSQPGMRVTESPVYVKVVAEASKWRERRLSSRRLTPANVVVDSPPIAVFERAQSLGRAVQAVSKKVGFNQALIAQPLGRALEEEVPEYACGDRKHRLSQMLMLLSGEISEIADGDDLLVRLKDGTIYGVDASAFESSIQDIDIRDMVGRISKYLSPENAKLYLATKYAACAEMVCSVGMVKLPQMWGVKSGEYDTHILDSIQELDRAKSSGRQSPDTFLSDISKYGIYRTELVSKECCMLARLFVDEKRPEYIHGSVIRAIIALSQREDPVLRVTSSEMKLQEDARIIQILSNLYGHPEFDTLCAWVKPKWEIRHGREQVARKTEEMAQDKIRLSTSGGEDSGEYEREGIKAALDLLT
jgi:hypothetical protein